MAAHLNLQRVYALPEYTAQARYVGAWLRQQSDLYDALGELFHWHSRAPVWALAAVVRHGLRTTPTTTEPSKRVLEAIQRRSDWDHESWYDIADDVHRFVSAGRHWDEFDDEWDFPMAVRSMVQRMYGGTSNWFRSLSGEIMMIEGFAGPALWPDDSSAQSSVALRIAARSLLSMPPGED